jgi:microcystin-dependent protein
MSDFFLGEIEMFGFDFAPKGWALCNGQLMPLQSNQALFSLLGTAYGGDGIRTFGLPDMRGRLPVGQGTGPGLTARVIGEFFGEENHTLLSTETPQHSHTVAVISNPDLANNSAQPGPTEFLAQTTFSGPAGQTTLVYVPDANPTNPMSASAVGKAGGSPHTNLMPLLALNFCICLTGIFPSRN